MLHDNKEMFEQAVLKTAEFLNIEPAIIEKERAKKAYGIN